MLLKLCFPSFTGKKTSWEKEKMLVTSIFYFSHNVFKRLLFQRRQKVMKIAHADLYTTSNIVYNFEFSTCNTVRLFLGMGPNTRIFENQPNIRIAKSYSIIRFMGEKFHMTEKILPKTV